MQLRYRDAAAKRYETVGAFVIHLPNCPHTPVSSEYMQLLWYGPQSTLKIDCGFRWDGPSAPALLREHLAPLMMRASLVHDALYELMRHRCLPQDCREWADGILRQICIEDGMPHAEAEAVYLAVREFGADSAAPVSEDEPEFKIYAAGAPE